MVATTNPQAVTTNNDITQCLAFIAETLTDGKAKNVVNIDISSITDITDYVVIASGTSNRHVRALASAVSTDAKAAGFTPIGSEGEADGEWVLVDLGCVVVHIMLIKTREMYDLEGLWNTADV